MRVWGTHARGVQAPLRPAFDLTALPGVTAAHTKHLIAVHRSCLTHQKREGSYVVRSYRCAQAPERTGQKVARVPKIKLINHAAPSPLQTFCLFVCFSFPPDSISLTVSVLWVCRHTPVNSDQGRGVITHAGGGDEVWPSRAEAGLNVNVSPSHNHTSGLPPRAECRAAGRGGCCPADTAGSMDTWILYRSPTLEMYLSQQRQGRAKTIETDTHTHCRWRATKMKIGKIEIAYLLLCPWKICFCFFF